nr:hypothetical protein [Tanacetum cinerariifolium]
RPGYHQHRQHRPQRTGGGELPGCQGPPADAGDRPGQADPHHLVVAAGDQPQLGGREAVRRCQGRACRLGSTDRGDRGRCRGGADRR